MTTRITSHFCGCLVSILLISNAFGQQTGDKTFSYARSEKVLSMMDANTNSQPVETVNINTKVTNAFGKSFKSATNVNWSKVDKNFQASFTVDGKETKALYNKKGRLVYTISYGSEKDLSSENRKMVKSAYVDYTITSAIEIKEDNRTIWVIKLEDIKSLIFVRLENGTLEETKHYQKAK